MSAPEKPTEQIVIEGVRDVAKTAVGGALTEKVALGLIGAVVTMYLGWVLLLPPDRREGHGPLDLIDALIGAFTSTWATWLAWTLFLSTLGVSTVVIRTLWRRNREQGRELAVYRRKEDGDRRSSHGADVAGMMQEVIALLPAKASGEQLPLDLPRGKEVKSLQPVQVGDAAKATRPKKSET